MTPPIARATIVPQASAAQSGRLRRSDGRSGELRLQRPQDGVSSHGQAQLLARARRFCSFFLRAARLRAVFRRLGARVWAGITVSSQLDVNRS